MRIGINLLPYSPGKHGGAEVYLYNTVSRLCALAPSDEFYFFGAQDVVDEYSKAGDNCRPVPLGRRFVASRLARVVAEQSVLPVLCARYRIERLVSNYVIPVFAPCKTVVIIHDLLVLRYPAMLERSKYVYWRIMIPASVRRSTFIVTVSRFSASEVESFFPAAVSKLFTTTEGIRPALAHANYSDLPATDITSGRYLLCVATFGKHKNLDLLVHAFAQIAAMEPELRLVFVGTARTPDAKHYQAKLVDLSTELGLQKQVQFADHVSNEVLATLYSHALALILPSLYEGFGLPVVEAQYFGCPVVCSNIGALSEIAGDAAVFFNPSSCEELSLAISTIIQRPKLREYLRKKGYKNVARYSWDQAASDMMRILSF